MARCEDFPCCGHESGCCPDYDENGKQLNMKCVCGAILPINNRSSLCTTCLTRGSAEDGDYPEFDPDCDEFDDPDW